MRQLTPSTLVVVLMMLMPARQQASNAVGVVNVHADPKFVVKPDAQVMVGGTVSISVVVRVQKAVLLQQSVARHVWLKTRTHGERFVTPVLKSVTVTFVPQQASVAVGVGPHVQIEPHCTV